MIPPELRLPADLPRWMRADLRALPEVPALSSGVGAGAAGVVRTGFAAHRPDHTRGSILVPVLVFVAAFIWRWRRP